ncbi:MAG TPA: hypothetical protein VFT29_10875 [Gemmatimonadaceae bacterium]|nr:hypothetical protein [Gemmatimonadaceae bacterium]
MRKLSYAGSRFIASVFAVAALAACSELQVPEPTAPLTAAATKTANTGWGDPTGFVNVCKKAGPPGEYYFHIEVTGGGDAYVAPDQELMFDGMTLVCVDLYKALNRDSWGEGVVAQVTVTEVEIPDGVAVDFIDVWRNDVQIDHVTGSSSATTTLGPDDHIAFGFANTGKNEVCTDKDASNYGGPLPCEYPPPPGKTFTIGPSSMEGHLKIPAGSWFNGGYSFKFKSNQHIATQFTVTAKVEVPVNCPYGGGPGGTILIPLGTRTYNVPAGNTNWLPTGDANSILSWMGAVQSPDLCGGFLMDNARGAIFTATVSQNPPTGTLVDFRFKYRDPAAKGKVDTNCTDPLAPKRNDAATCGASWSQTVTDP